MKAKSIIAITVLFFASLLLLFDCNNPFMERILGPRSNAESPYTGHPGNGTEFDPWIVHDEETLRKVGTEAFNPASGDHTWHLGAYYFQVRNITLSGIPWMPIGTIGASPHFTGFYDGNDRTISGLTIIDSSQSDLGMFIYIQAGAVVKKLGLVDVNIHGDANVGALAAQNAGRVEQCYSAGTIQGEGNNIGGLVGANHNMVENCYSTTHVSNNAGGSNVGGLAGFNTGTVRNSYATGTVTGNLGPGNVGGLVGTNQETVENCYATGNVTAHHGGGPNSNIGGLVGANVTGGIVQNCYATGSVQGNDNIGGIVGSTGNTVRNCVALNQRITGAIAIGRIAGEASPGTTSNNYARTMLLTGSPVASTENGETIIGNWYSSSWWNFPPEDGGWNLVSPWLWEIVWNNALSNPDRLPTLRNMPGRTQNPRVN